MLRPGVPLIVFACAFGWRLRCLVLSASQFQHILTDPGRTSKAYLGHAGHELSLLSGKRRGIILSELCKKELARLHPHSTIEEPTTGSHCDGARTSAPRAEYSFTLDALKIESKCAQMSWEKGGKCWHFQFYQVKVPWTGFRDRAPFDVLCLTLFSPDSLHIIKHDLRTGVSTAGPETGKKGHRIFVRGAKGQECWRTARSQILSKFLAAGQCELVSYVDLSAFEVRSWLTKQIEGLAALHDLAYQEVPLNHMVQQLRGLRIEEVAFEVDQILNPNCAFSRASSEVDWLRGEIRVELKSGQMCYNKVRRHWECCFQNIKCGGAGARDQDAFDELWLVIYSPVGLHFLKHPGGKVRLSHTGWREKEMGRHMHVYASTLDVREALDEMLNKMEDWGCQSLATIFW